MTMYNLIKSDTPKFILYLRKGTLKMAHPVPVYVEVTPPGIYAHFKHLDYQSQLRFPRKTNKEKVFSMSRAQSYPR